MSGELARVLAELRDREHLLRGQILWSDLHRIEAAARADHPEDWPPKDGEVRNVHRTGNDGNDYTDFGWEVGIKGEWVAVCAHVNHPTLAALRQLAKEGQL